MPVIGFQGRAVVMRGKEPKRLLVSPTTAQFFIIERINGEATLVHMRRRAA